MVPKAVRFLIDCTLVARQARAIWRSPVLGLPRPNLVWAFVQLNFRAALHKHFGIRTESPLRLFGSRFEYLDLTSLVVLFNEIFAREQYYFHSTNDQPLIIDCGSNIGASILYFKRLYPRSRIIALEPFDLAFAVLMRNIQQNRLTDVTIHNLALAGSNGERNLYFDPLNTGALRMSLLPERIHGLATPVRTSVLSTFINESVDFLKLDIEGMELDVLLELAESHALKLVRNITVEYHHHISLGDDHLSRVLQILEENSFTYHVDARFRNSRLPECVYQDVMIYAANCTSEMPSSEGAP